MSADPKSQGKQQPESNASYLILRLIWVFLGPLALMLLLMSAGSKSESWLTGIDITYFIVSTMVIVARWREQASVLPKTVYGDPSTATHFRRYVFVAVPLMICAWILAKVLAIYVWRDA